MTLLAGQSFGPVHLGQRAETLGASGLERKEVSEHGNVAFYTVGPYHVRTCAGAVDDIWIDDVRTAPACLFANGPVERSIKREDLLKRFHGCHDLPPRTGGAFVECEGGGVRFGYGMGDFLQVRVAPTGSELDETCDERVEGDHPISLSADDARTLVERTLDLDLLAPYWHSDKPGRAPLRVIETTTTGRPELRMFGDPVRWITRAEIGGAAYFEFTTIEARTRRTRVEFAYPIEGVKGEIVFRKRGDQWSIESKRVSEK